MAKNNSRTTNTIFNFTSSLGGQLVTIIMQFVVRTVFIKTLGKSYLGINGLFSNILTMLSLAELGVGSAILYKLYDPIAKHDHHRIALLMKFYKTVYRFIGLVVFAVGVCLIPFLPRLISDYDRLETLHINAAFVFLLYLLQSVSSYLFFAYKSAIVKAHQKEYILNLVRYLFRLGLTVVQVILLVLFRNFNLYVFTMVAEVIGMNLVNARISDRMYPYIKEKTDDKISLTEVKETFKDCGAILLYKLNGVVVKATDNIVLSVFMGLDMVGIYSNYYIFYINIVTLFDKVFNSVGHSLGNLHATDHSKHEYEVFEVVMLFSAILGCTAMVGIFVCGDELIRTWVGGDWVLAQPFSFLMGMEIFDAAYKKSLSKYRTTMGLFRQAMLRPLAGVIINIVVSVALVRSWGICGVLVGTVSADWLTFMWFDPMIIHKYGFENGKSVAVYYGKFLSSFAIACAVGAADYLLCTHFLVGVGWLSVIVHACICGITVPAAFVLIYWRTQEGRYLRRVGFGYIRKLTKKFGR